MQRCEGARCRKCCPDFILYLVAFYGIIVTPYHIHNPPRPSFPKLHDKIWDGRPVQDQCLCAYLTTWVGLPILCFICCNFSLASLVFWCPAMVASTNRLISRCSSSCWQKYSRISSTDFRWWWTGGGECVCVWRRGGGEIRK